MSSLSHVKDKYAFLQHVNGRSFQQERSVIMNELQQHKCQARKQLLHMFYQYLKALDLAKEMVLINMNDNGRMMRLTCSPGVFGVLEQVIKSSILPIPYKAEVQKQFPKPPMLLISDSRFWFLNNSSQCNTRYKKTNVRIEVIPWKEPGTIADQSPILCPVHLMVHEGCFTKSWRTPYVYMKQLGWMWYINSDLLRQEQLLQTVAPPINASGTPTEDA